MLPDFTSLSADAALRVESLELARGERLLARDLSFSLRRGEALLVLGPNGAGKSTLLRCLAGLLQPARGRIAFYGSQSDETGVGAAHYLGHQDGLKASLSVIENLAFWSAMLGGAAGRENGDASPHEALAAFGLAHVAETPAGYLSAGQRRRVALARLLVAHRPIWLLDEPATALDAASQAQLASVMAAHRASGGVIVAATHAALGLDGAQELRLGEAV